MEPETRYARSGDVNVAYQVTGEGPFDVLQVPGFVSHIELAWQVPEHASFIRSLSSFCRLIRLDKRGTGMSDRVSGAPTLETRMDDVRAVLDAVGSERAALLGSADGGAMSILFAATYPDRTWALILSGAYARRLWAADYPWGLTDAEARSDVEFDRSWGDPQRILEFVEVTTPGLDEESKLAQATLLRQSASPGAVAALRSMNSEIDVRHVLPAIRVPTLVLNRAEQEAFFTGSARYLADHIAGARHVEIPSGDQPLYAGYTDRIVEESRRFLTEVWNERAWEDPDANRVLATVLFTDIVGSTARAAELGDARWRELLREHHALIRRQLVRFRGTEIDTAGDGFFASFDGPARAIRCASAISEALNEVGLEVRAGLHTGECELHDGKVGGIAVHIGARVAKEAGPGEVLVSSTVKDLVAGSGIDFRERGDAELKGVPGKWRLFAVER
jgi:class 3 adenylate cyclase/pimeloyl-ACP methyl ester carboxylesterase